MAGKKIRLTIAQLGRAVWAHFWHQQEQDVPQPNEERVAIMLYALWEWAYEQKLDLELAFEKSRVLFGNTTESAAFPTGNEGTITAMIAEKKL
jgi:hypothetical protein